MMDGGSFSLRLRLVNARVAKLSRSLSELVPALGAFVGRGGCIGVCVMRRARLFVVSMVAATRGAVDRGWWPMTLGRWRLMGSRLSRVSAN